MLETFFIFKQYLNLYSISIVWEERPIFLPSPRQFAILIDNRSDTNSLLNPISSFLQLEIQISRSYMLELSEKVNNIVS